jgi:hypothetical protein
VTFNPPLSSGGILRKASMLAATLVVLGLSSSALASSMAPYWACEGKKAGDSCKVDLAPEGVCKVQQDCTDDAETTVDECLWCAEDPSSGCSAAGTGLAGLPVVLMGAAFFVRRGRGQPPRCER